MRVNMMWSWHLFLQKYPCIFRIPISWYHWCIPYHGTPFFSHQQDTITLIVISVICVPFSQMEAGGSRSPGVHPLPARSTCSMQRCPGTSAISPSVDGAPVHKKRSFASQKGIIRPVFLSEESAISDSRLEY